MQQTTIKLIRTDSGHPDFVKLVKLLDAELAERDGDEHAFYARFNKIAVIRHAVLAYEMTGPWHAALSRNLLPAPWK